MYIYIKQWKREIQHKFDLPSNRPVPIVLLVNKCDGKNSGKYFTLICEHTYLFIQINECLYPMISICINILVYADILILNL
jgi:GTPase SAR1 family protein